VAKLKSNYELETSGGVEESELMEEFDEVEKLVYLFHKSRKNDETVEEDEENVEAERDAGIEARNSGLPSRKRGQSMGRIIEQLEETRKTNREEDLRIEEERHKKEFLLLEQHTKATERNAGRIADSLEKLLLLYEKKKFGD